MSPSLGNLNPYRQQPWQGFRCERHETLVLLLAQPHEDLAAIGTVTAAARSGLATADSAADEALCAFARAAGADLPATLNFVGQVGSSEAGRPDIVGTDDAQTERLLIEAKFAAGLRAQLPSGYLSRLGNLSN